MVTFAGPRARTQARSAAKKFKAEREFAIVAGFAATLTHDEVLALAEKPGLFRIEEDRVYRVALDAANRDFGTEAARQTFGVDGSGVGICIVDTGVDASHEQLDDPGKVVAWADFVNGVPNPYDDQGHGTHVASIAAGSGTGGASASTFQGVAPGAAVYATKVLDSTGQGTTSQVVSGIDWCVQQPGVQIISMSLSTTEGSDGLDSVSQASNDAVDAGKIVVAGAGNSGDRPGSVGSPGAAAQVIAVGAAAEWSAAPGAANHSSGVYLAPFSSRGPTLGPAPRIKPDILGPGVSIMGASAGLPAGYGAASGTSMSTPFVSGAIALALEAAPGLTPAQVESLLQTTAQDWGPPGKDNHFGWGLLDGLALVSAAADGPPAATAFPELVAIGGSVPDDGVWSMSFDVGAADLSTPIAATVLVEGVQICRWWFFGICLAYDWSPDLSARLIDPAGAVLHESNCTIGGDCGAVGLQETVYAMPTVAGSYRLEVYPNDADPNLGAGGDFDVSLSNGTFAAVEVTAPPPLAGYWSLDDGAGATAADASGNGYDATLVNGPSWDLGRVGGGLTFHGVDDRVDAPCAALDGLRDATVALWVRTTKTGPQALVSAAGPGNDNELLLFLASDTELQFFTGESGGTFVAWTVPTLADGVWHHLAVLRDQAAGTVSLYRDGLLEGAQATALNRLDVDAAGVVLGQEQDAIGGGFDPAQALTGSLDEVYVYRRILSESEIVDLASPALDATPPTAPSGLAASNGAPAIQLDWSPADDPETGVAAYRIYRATSSGGATTLLTELPAAQTSHVDASAAAETTYFYTVTAVNGHGVEGPPSNEASGSAGPDLLGHWMLDDAAGSIAADASGYGHDGTLANGPAWTSGRLGGALGFDGNDDRVDLPASVLDGLADASLTLWLQTTKTGMQGLVSAANGANDNELLLFLASDTEVRFYTGESSGSFAGWTVPSLADGAWHHLAVVRDAGAGEVTLYLDGVSEGAQATLLSALAVDAGGFVLGQEQDAVGRGLRPGTGACRRARRRAALPTRAQRRRGRHAGEPARRDAAVRALGAVGDDRSADGRADLDCRSGPGVRHLRVPRVPRHRVGHGEGAARRAARRPDDLYRRRRHCRRELLLRAQRRERRRRRGRALERGDRPRSRRARRPLDARRDGGHDRRRRLGRRARRHARQRPGVAARPRGRRARLRRRRRPRRRPPGRARRARRPHAGAVAAHHEARHAGAGERGERGQRQRAAAVPRLGQRAALLQRRGRRDVRLVAGPVARGRLVAPPRARARDVAAGEVTLYLDGVSQGARATALSALAVDAGGFVLGQEQDSVGGGFDANQALAGALDDVRVYRRVLGAAEVASLAGEPLDATPPTAPAGLVTTENGVAVDLGWSAAADAESGVAAYRVYRDDGAGGAKALLAEVAATQTAYSDAAVAVGSLYSYEVTAVNGHGLEGPASAEASGASYAGLAAYWRLDDAAGLTASDATAHGNDGTLSGGPAWGPGRIDGGLAFDGFDDSVAIDGATADGLADLTIAFWMRTSKTGMQGLVSAANAGNDNELLVFLLNHRWMRLYTGESGGSYVQWFVPPLADGAWHHIAIVRDATGDRATLYVDGVSRGNIATVLSPIDVDSAGFVLGQEQDAVGGGFDPNQAFEGSLDDVRLYGRLLAASEVQALANP